MWSYRNVAISNVTHALDRTNITDEDREIVIDEIEGAYEYLANSEALFYVYRHAVESIEPKFIGFILKNFCAFQEEVERRKKEMKDESEEVGCQDVEK